MEGKDTKAGASPEPKQEQAAAAKEDTAAAAPS